MGRFGEPSSVEENWLLERFGVCDQWTLLADGYKVAVRSGRHHWLVRFERLSDSVLSGGSRFVTMDDFWSVHVPFCTWDRSPA